MAGKGISLNKHKCNCGPKGNLETDPGSEASRIMQAPTCLPVLKEDVHLKNKKREAVFCGLSFCPTTLTVQNRSNIWLAKLSETVSEEFRSYLC